MTEDIENQEQEVEAEAEDVEGLDNGCIVTGALTAIAIAMLLFGIWKLAPLGRTWLDNRFSKEVDICPDLEEIEPVICPDPPECPACPECAITSPPPWAPDGFTDLDTYLALTDKAIYDTNQTIGKVEVLYEIYYNRGNSTYERVTVLNDEDWMDIRRSVGIEINHIFEGVAEAWPPGPYDSSNPLLDSHARLLTSIAYLQRLDNALTSFELNPSNFQMTYIGEAKNLVLDQLSKAETGLNMVR